MHLLVHASSSECWGPTTVMCKEQFAWTAPCQSLLHLSALKLREYQLALMLRGTMQDEQREQLENQKTDMAARLQQTIARSGMPRL